MCAFALAWCDILDSFFRILNDANVGESYLMGWWQEGKQVALLVLVYFPSSWLDLPSHYSSPLSTEVLRIILDIIHYQAPFRCPLPIRLSLSRFHELRLRLANSRA